MNKANAKNFNKAESTLILSDDISSKFHVYQITNENELSVLQKPSADINPNDPLLQTLAQRMLWTVQDTSHPGVGIAAPQVGINRNVIWVQRFDKPDEPFEFYINPKITWHSTLLQRGLEGCLSIPDRKETIHRSYAIQLQHLDKNGDLIEEHIEGFTAVIFQHEIDHLHGILYPDRLEEQEKKSYALVQDKFVVNFIDTATTSLQL